MYSSGWNHASRKTAYILKQTCVWYVYYLRLKHTFTPIFLGQMPDQFDVFFDPKNASEKNAQNITLPSIGQLQKRTSSRATDVVWQ